MMGKRLQERVKNKGDAKKRVWAVLAIVTSALYLVWRAVFTIPDHRIYGWVSTICGVVLLVAELFAFVESLDAFRHVGRSTVPEMPIIPESWYPDVDILIATHSEDTDLLYKTINGCKYMRYPNRSKVHIYVCDDSDRPEMAELASKMGVGYLGLSDNKDAKAGNLNNALGKTNSPWVVTFDSDMIPTHDFLMETVPYVFLPIMKKLDDGTWVPREEDEIDPDYKIGFIQVPQSFYNPDLFQFNLFSEKNIPNEQDYFFRFVNVKRNSSKSPIYAGSNTVISREALERIGGIQTKTITEDFATGIRIQMEGYSCYALDKELVHGLAPVDFSGLVRQRTRWARGTIQAIRKTKLFFSPHLGLSAKFSYLVGLLYWWSFFRMLLMIAAPVVTVLFRVPLVVCTLRDILLIWLPTYFIYNTALKVLSGRTRDKRWDGVCGMVLLPYLIIPMILETLGIKEKKFFVTSKKRSAERTSELRMGIPHAIILAFDVTALVIASLRFLDNQEYNLLVSLYWLALNALYLIMAILFVGGRSNYRVDERFPIKVPVDISYEGNSFQATTMDLSDTGLSVAMEQAVYMPSEGADVDVHIKTVFYETSLTATCVHVERKGGNWIYGLRIKELDGKDKDEYFQVLYDRDHSLAKQVSLLSGVFDDIFVNIDRRLDKRVPSQRKLPRIELDIDMLDTQGNFYHVVNCNYEYILFSETQAKGTEGAPDRIELPLPDSQDVLICERVPEKEGLYHIVNWGELVTKNAFMTFLCSAGDREKLSSPARTL